MSLHSLVLALVLVGCGDADGDAHAGPCATTIATSAPMASSSAGAGGESDDSGGSADSTTEAASTASPGTTSTGDESSGDADDTEGAGESGASESGETGASGETTDASSTGDSWPGTTGAPGETAEASSTGGTEGTGDTTGDGQAGPSFAADVWPLLADNCGCHQDNNGAGKLHLTSKDAYDNLVGVASDQLPSMQLVEPGDASNSYLWHKMDNTHKSVGGEGKKMPPGGLLGQSEREIVQQWIDQGAQP
ncbi:hypothetical protein [Nannocystis radixulma]|uniref:Cytochrome c domain-containing protein n=1 Tax=Nannocystis radixulma TaxID=2995305 RepID=A0ABT5BLS3_9BACT|nr:hypothetical protein [Nannocystis radixulma]MDC0674474.1 hypothetical protein [Nannocystis radixulma]